MEVLPFAYPFVSKKLENMGADPKIRILKNGNIFVSDNGNYIIDCNMKIKDAKEAEKMLNSIPGIVENGIFTKFSKIIIGSENGAKTL